MNYYPDQLRRIADLCEALSKAEGEVLYLKGPHQVLEDEVVLGSLSDQIGGSYSFSPAGDKA